MLYAPLAAKLTPVLCTSACHGYGGCICRHDLDLQLMLNVDEYAEQDDPGSFIGTRKQCLDDLSSKLCGPPAKGAKGDPRKVAKSGWRQLDHSEHCLFLRHDQLEFELDVQVNHLVKAAPAVIYLRALIVVQFEAQRCLACSSNYVPCVWQQSHNNRTCAVSTG